MSLKIEKKNEGTKDTVFLTGRLERVAQYSGTCIGFYRA